MGSNFSYTQLVIGDCGHTCGAWPQISKLGGKSPRVICEECTKAKYGIDSDETVWVYVQTQHPSEKRERRKEGAKRANRPKRTSKLTEILRQGGLF